MVNLEEITQQDWDLMVYHRTKARYTQGEADELVGLVRKYIDPGQGSCFKCGNTLREAKTKLAEFVVHNKDKVDSILNVKTEELQPEVKIQTSKNGNKKTKR